MFVDGGQRLRLRPRPRRRDGRVHRREHALRALHGRAHHGDGRVPAPGALTGLDGGASGRHLSPMCGRMVLTDAHDAMARLFEAEPANDLPEVPNYNVCPTNRHRRRDLRATGDAPLPPDALGPPAALVQGAERRAAPHQRPLRDGRREARLPRGGARAALHRPGARLLRMGPDRDQEALALLRHARRTARRWPSPRSGRTGARGRSAGRPSPSLTCAANGEMARIHDRLPVILAPEDWPLWLGEAGKGAARLMVPVPDGTLALVRGRHRGQLQPGAGRGADRADGAGEPRLSLAPPRRGRAMRGRERGYGVVVAPQPSKLMGRVRFPLAAPAL